MVAPPMIDMPQLIDNGGRVSDGDRGGSCAAGDAAQNCLTKKYFVTNEHNKEYDDVC